MSREIVARLMDEGHEVVILANEGAEPNWGNTKEVPIGRGKMVKSIWIPPVNPPERAIALINSYCGTQKLDLIIAHWDVFCLLPGWLKDVAVPILVYIPIDSAMTERWAQFCEGARKVVLYSDYGYAEASKFLPASVLDCIFHGVDCSVFKPSTRSKAELREEIAPVHTADPVPRDDFLVTFTGANSSSRKNIPLLLRAFGKFHASHPDSTLYLHSNIWGTGHHIPSIIKDLGLDDCVRYPKLNPILHPAEDEHFAKLYSASDLYATASSGEGFGLPLIEAQSCGLPVLAPDNSSHTELVKGHGFLAECLDPDVYVDYPSYVPTSNFYTPPNMKSFVAQMEFAYSEFKAGKEDSYRKAARKFAEKYGWPLIMQGWRRLLKEMEDDLEMRRTLKEDFMALSPKAEMTFFE